jgi:cellulose biosynthesis protein BcsQ
MSHMSPAFNPINPITICWSVKGGSGTSTVAAVLAMLSPTFAKNPLLVDMCGDSATLVGIDTAASVGLSDWFASQADPHVLDTLCVHTKSGIDVLQTSARIAPDERRWEEFVDWLIDQSDQRVVILDTGAHLPLVPGAQSLLVMRPCYLAVRRAATSGVHPTGIVLVRELERSLTNADIEAAIGSPIVAEIPMDPLIARSVDAGLANVRLPRSLTRPLRKLLREGALLKIDDRSRVA